MRIESASLPEALSDAARAFATARHELLIGGEWVAAADGRSFETSDPATGRKIADVAYAGAEDVDRAVRAARAAFDDGRWSAVAPARRTQVMLALAEAIDAHADELAELESLDNGKPVGVARRIDVSLAAEHLRYFAGWPTKITGETLPVARPRMHCYTRKEPVGVCGQIIPWNFPLLMAVWKIAPALAAGCTVVLKPAEQTPLTALRLGQLALDADLPDGVLNVVTGDGHTGAALVEHAQVDKVAFTGSTAVGREIGMKAGRALKRVTLELGGKSPNIVLPDADLEAAIEGSYQAMYYNTGQACNAGSRLFVHRRQYDEVVAGLVEAAARTRLGPGLDPRTDMGPLISAEQLERVHGYIESGKAEGAELVAGGGRHDGDGHFVEPTLFSATDDDLSIAREETFGPVLVALPYDSIEEVAWRANDTEYGLAAGLWTRDISNAHTLAALLQAGDVWVNTWRAGDPSAPFGGFKASGVGREHGRLGLDAYLENKTVWINLA
ncbi:MAG: aldehyde dehydrogenase family protein [Thermoleophilaceae bacterium]